MSAAPSAQHFSYPGSDARPGGERVVTTRTAWRTGLPQAPANDNDGDLGPFNRVRPKHTLTVEAILEWTYRRQRAHQILHAEMDWIMWAMDRAGYLSNPDDCRKVHYDAALVHEAVLALGPDVAAMVIAAALLGDWPRWMDIEECRPYPVEPCDRYEFHGWHVDAHGKRAEHVKKTYGYVEIPKEEWEVVGRKKMRRAKNESPEIVPVDGCLIRWNPEPEFVEANNRLVAVWQTTRPVLAKALRDAPFKEHALALDALVAANDNMPDVANDNEAGQIEMVA